MIAINKRFDCVQMKRNIQNELRKEYAGLSVKEKNRVQEKRISRNPILKRFLRNSELSSKHAW